MGEVKIREEYRYCLCQKTLLVVKVRGMDFTKRQNYYQKLYLSRQEERNEEDRNAKQKNYVRRLDAKRNKKIQLKESKITFKGDKNKCNSNYVSYSCTKM